ncbi:DUF1376 domain-containing protein [Cereibacter azotoformans]|uniref:DUF1376 domain-containing protein n=1 Tax=Cereibacter azotoformans TaxID=43057 RepID=UPI000E35EB11|nr:DUF1376 domain-containing protein [Cereibacter azotoformans]AXQ93189.1 DUF1376 domain-containing protein [Cereibacter sphaeroides]UIJ31500.1 DUF1376 domain-containing protein [Cereibacter azotoformans]
MQSDHPHETEVIGDFWEYPLAFGETLSSHEWVPLHINRLLTSRFVARALAEGRRADIGTALLLWCEAFRQDPAGTLPDNDFELARLAGFGADIEGWRAARAGALYGWRETHIVNEDSASDNPRLGHPMIAGIARDMHRRKRGRDQARTEGAKAVARTRVKKKLLEINCTRAAESADVVTAIADWLGERDLYITSDNVRAAFEATRGGPKLVQFQ